jgi:hypothetical protein
VPGARSIALFAAFSGVFSGTFLGAFSQAARHSAVILL